MTGAEQVTGTTPHAAVRARPVVHRITTSTAAVADDPDRRELAGLLREVQRSGRGSFLFAHSRAGQPDEDYLQAVRHVTGWTLEARDPGRHDGLAGRPVRVEVTDTALVEDVFVWWTQGLSAWRRLPWNPVTADRRW